MRASVLAVLLAPGGPAVADPIQGLDDPAFLARFDRAPQGDDPTALPIVNDWLRATLCPETRDQCAAHVAGFGHPYDRATLAQPLTSLILTADFFATPRGRLILLRSAASQLGGDPANAPTLAAARKIDACLADAVLAAVPGPPLARPSLPHTPPIATPMKTTGDPCQRNRNFRIVCLALALAAFPRPPPSPLPG